MRQKPSNHGRGLKYIRGQSRCLLCLTGQSAKRLWHQSRRALGHILRLRQCGCGDPARRLQKRRGGAWGHSRVSCLPTAYAAGGGAGVRLTGHCWPACFSMRLAMRSRLWRHTSDMVRPSLSSAAFQRSISAGSALKLMSAFFMRSSWQRKSKDAIPSFSLAIVFTALYGPCNDNA